MTSTVPHQEVKTITDVNEKNTGGASESKDLKRVSQSNETSMLKPSNLVAKSQPNHKLPSISIDTDNNNIDEHNISRRKRVARSNFVVNYCTVGVENFAFGDTDSVEISPMEKRVAKQTRKRPAKSPSPTKKETSKRKLDTLLTDDSFMVTLKTNSRRSEKLQSDEDRSSNNNSLTPNGIKTSQSNSDSPNDKHKTKLIIKLPKKSNGEVDEVEHITISDNVPAADDRHMIEENDIADGEEEDQAVDNEDFCSACGGIGNFLCCERCPKSFHFTCLNPPIESDNLPEGEWFCSECVAMRTPLIPQTRGIFSSLLNYASKKNPFQFTLPKNMVKGRSTAFENSVIKVEDLPIKVESTLAGKSEISNAPETLLSPNAVNGTTGRRPRVTKNKQEKPAVSTKLNGQEVVDKAAVETNTPTAVSLPTPPFFDSEYDNGRVRAKISKLINKKFGSETIIYRLPENGVILDFVEAIENQNMIENLQGKWTPTNTLLALDKFAEEGFIEKAYLKEESKLRFGLTSYKAEIGNVYFLQSENMNTENVQLERKNLAKYNMREDIESLLETAMNTNLQANVFDTPSSVSDSDDDDIIAIKSDHSSDSKSSRSVTQDSTDNEVEHIDLLAIKRLIKLKGRNTLMDFLHTHKK
ncbi:hypothetical protein NADFUDRAFT_52418 [Nadsonia fulvescens var. elongata DSM 6958]|uniref:PHD-type domain-containing protein n=1 Tax=Nadsonia fulvescens var. elongata DSM 6958 TaxID=857566 RepID=A0A1E3PHA9_9ASCO|nr:hypothetical protein NADFUDRAFT_52418 [Nadsonia fulvescens var. elongata DSM 6958]